MLDNIYFFKDVKEKKLFTWDYLVNDINNTLTYNPYCFIDNYYEVFKQLIISLLLGKEITLLDSDFTELELKNILGFSKVENFFLKIEKGDIAKINNENELIDRIRITNENWKLSLYTSGTTGNPKKVTHSFKSITRFVKYDEKNKNDIWGFAYNPTHMAGVQVFFQALLNRNTIVRLFDLNPNQIKNEIKGSKITHISATPTFYLLLLPCDQQFESVKRITSGGEKFNDKLMSQVKYVFPNAKITNVYASTEAGTLFASENDLFYIKPEVSNLIRILDNELLVHNSLLGIMDQNIGEWYKTGDLVEIYSDNPKIFRFISRKSDIINSGGYKINPQEVEAIILSIPGIKQARVFSKKNSVLGNIICGEVVCENTIITEVSIREYLKSNLQEYKIPRVILFVDELSKTRTGKIKRT